MTNVSLGSIGVAVDNAVVKSVQCEPQLLSERITKKQKKIQKINLKRIREIFNPNQNYRGPQLESGLETGTGF